MAETQNIEDVLSSIRRLVSEEVSAQAGRHGPALAAVPVRPAPADPPSAPEPAPAADRLVLAPSHRVVEPEDPFQAIRALAQEERDARDAEAFAPEAAPAPLVADLGSAPDDAAPWRGGPMIEGYSEDTDFEAEDAASSRDAVASAIAAAGVLQAFAAEETALRRADARTGAPAAASEPAAAPEEDEAPAAGAKPPVPPPTAVVPVAPAPEAARPAPVTGDASPVDDDDGDAVMEAVLAGALSDDDDEEDDMAGGPDEASEGAVAKVAMMPAPRSAPAKPAEGKAPAPEAGGDGANADDDILAGGIDATLRAGPDADALRELVAEVVRQELAGALGERITRNVRKLVRRELRSMFASEEFE
ncbi:hypothetical protein [Jannaschia sp. W003]|uniref:hypothetical protein n=1 Tax=Jannaschia sp. W003 TaxID=2867012 RepID=UPI0021A81E64|nr:hypothetical protein [Jannaschia sp. W003]UWQ20194.1 hypothetical protein K3554_09270 [Jannaschia sp. W003]